MVSPAMRGRTYQSQRANGDYYRSPPDDAGDTKRRCRGQSPISRAVILLVKSFGRGWGGILAC